VYHVPTLHHHKASTCKLAAEETGIFNTRTGFEPSTTVREWFSFIVWILEVRNFIDMSSKKSDCVVRTYREVVAEGIPASGL
jgi:hypothetical protein